MIHWTLDELNHYLNAAFKERIRREDFQSERKRLLELRGAMPIPTDKLPCSERGLRRTVRNVNSSAEDIANLFS